MQNSQNKKKLQIVLLVLIAVLTLGIGYASITAINLIINGNGTASAVQENFQVYFTNSSITDGKGTVSIDEDDATIGYFDITGLSKIGDYAEATYTVLNNSNGVGADISLQLTNSNNEYFKVTETVADSQLQAGDTTTATVKVEMIKTPLNDTVSTTITATLKATPLENDTATGGSPASVEPIPDPVSFTTDSWATIQKAVQNNNISAYQVGDTKTVTIGANNYTVRIANKSTYDWCEDENYSQTACGFVVEFVDIIQVLPMHYTNLYVGGYAEGYLYGYLKGDIYNSLPDDLKQVISTTRVISGYGCLNGWDDSTFTCPNPDNNGENFTTIDKLYLLSTEEVYGIDDGQAHYYDTAYGTSHQLEYYNINQVSYSTTNWSGTNLDKAIKQKEYTMNFDWWLRSPASGSVDASTCVYNNGARGGYGVTSALGVSPAFGIG